MRIAICALCFVLSASPALRAAETLNIITIAGGGPDAATRVVVNGSQPAGYSAAEARFTPRLYLSGPVTADLRYAGTACDPAALPGGLAGAIALIEQSDCLVGAIANLEGAGAVGAVAIHAADMMTGNVLDDGLTGEPGGITIPALVVVKSAGDALKAAVAAGPAVNVTLQGWNDGDRGPGSAASLALPIGLALNAKRGFLLVGDQFDSRVRRLDLMSGDIDTFAGGDPGFSGVGGRVRDLELYKMVGLALDPGRPRG